MSLLKQDPDIMLAQNALEDGIGGASDLRTTAVFSPYVVDPVVFMWDKTRHPDFNILQDIGQTDTKVVTFQTAQIDYLLGAGVFRPKQVDYSFTGSPERLATDRSVVVGGFVTNDPWTYGVPRRFRTVDLIRSRSGMEEWNVGTAEEVLARV